jgi:predicted GIY-YIG superfamily endonuclease
MGRPVAYLICWAGQPIGNLANRRAMAEHYCGSTYDLAARLRQHRNGTGARIMAAVSAAGIPWFVVRVELGGHAKERAWKRSHQLRRHCPMCRPAPWEVGR